MNIGLLYTPVSIYQMTRGALVLFVGAFSVVFLHRRLHLYQWLSLLTVMVGVSLVGFSGSLIKDTLHDATNLARRALVPLLTRSALDEPVEEPVGSPEATKVLIGTSTMLLSRAIFPGKTLTPATPFRHLLHPLRPDFYGEPVCS
jgi:hypothetical protein